MPKDLYVLLIEDDLYARDLMSMLLARDWRTRIVAEAGSEDDVRQFLQHPIHNLDVVLLDTEAPGDPDWPFRIAEIAAKNQPPPRIICTATKGNAQILKRLTNAGFGGYLIKREIGYSLATAVARSTKNSEFVLTPGSYSLALKERIPLPSPAVVLDGRKSTLKLTPREKEIARLAILFNHPHRELSDELLIRADQVAKHVSNVYAKLGLDEVLSGELTPDTFFEDRLILAKFAEILERVAQNPGRRKTSDMATLAFHMLTVPQIEYI